MKKLFLILMSLLPISWLGAQNITDATRFNMEDLQGSARLMSMGGAFGALGGDVSAIKLNPASSAVFLNNEVAFSFDLSAYKNNTHFEDGSLSYHNNDVDLNQAGVVFVFNNYDESATVSRLSFGITYDKVKSFDNRFKARGTSNETIGDMFLDYAQGVPLDLFTPRSGETLDDLYDYLGYANEGFNNNRLQAAYLGYEAFLFDAVNPNDMNNVDYVSNVGGSSFDHFYEQYEKGLNGKVSFNGGLAIEDRFYLGLNLNSHFIDFRQTTIANERINGNSAIKEINYGNYLDTKGSGFSFQLGGIARLGDMFRVGLTYESPTWYSIKDETSQILRTQHETVGEIYVDPMVINVYPRYSLRTPSKYTGSIAAVFGENGLLSFDYSYKDYAKTKFTSDGFAPVNQDISDNLQAVSTFRAGGEYRLDNLSLRAGFRYETSPYKDNTLGDLQGYSAGLGYDFGSLAIDFGYAWSKRDFNLDLIHTNYSEKADIKNTLSNYVLTLSFPL